MNEEIHELYNKLIFKHIIAHSSSESNLFFISNVDF